LIGVLVAEAIRYLDVCPLSTLESPLKESYEALLAPLLLNTALCALKIPADYRLAYDSATRAIEKLPLIDADKGKYILINCSWSRGI
jgi:peptidyl-prolyl isomerase D